MKGTKTGVSLAVVFSLLLAASIPALAADDDATKEYSVTLVDRYAYVGNLSDYGKDYLYPVIQYHFPPDGWDETFCWNDTAAWDIDFGKLTSGYEGLDEADFHFHWGHGGPDQNTGHKEICLYNWSFGDEDPDDVRGDVSWDEVYGKWELDSEWAFILSCSLLEGDEVSYWGSALNRSHMILGFSTPAYGDDRRCLDEFLLRTLQAEQTVIESYYRATLYNYNASTNATAISDTLDQWNNDHFWGHGTVSPDESPNDGTVWFARWTCGG